MTESIPLERLKANIQIGLRRYDIPDHMHDGLREYILSHRPVGSFLQSVLSNNLLGAVDNADYINNEIIHKYVEFLYNCAPILCWGSEDKYDAWLREKNDG